MPMLYLWQTYQRLRRRKGGNGFSASPLEWPDFGWFIQINRARLAPWEIRMIERLDDLFIDATRKAQPDA